MRNGGRLAGSGGVFARLPAAAAAPAIASVVPIMVTAIATRAACVRRRVSSGTVVSTQSHAATPTALATTSAAMNGAGSEGNGRARAEISAVPAMRSTTSATRSHAFR